MKKYSWVQFIFIVLAVLGLNGVGLCGTPVDKSELQNALAGKMIVDASEANGNKYQKFIYQDGTWVGGDERGRVVASGKWWINDRGQYCQTNNRTELNEGCINVEKEGDRFVGYSASPPSRWRRETMKKVAVWKIEDTDRAIAYQKQMALNAMPAAGGGPDKKRAHSWGAWGLASENRNH